MSKATLGQLDKYTLLAEIGSGGFSTVYKAHDPSLDRNVALKVLLPHLTRDASVLERFRQEARQAARLKHPNIVTIYEVGEADGRFYIAMEYLDGQPLSQLIESAGSLPPLRAVAIVRQVGAAMDYAHTEGLIHRDVKPSNIVVGKDDQATLTDFGLVKYAGGGGVTTTGVVLGTPEYMSPEQVLGQEVDARTDLYTLGVVIYQMLTGRVPFEGTTPFAVQKGHTEMLPPDPRQLNPALGEHIAEVLLKSLAKRPDERYQSGADFTSALVEAVEREQEQYWTGIYEQGVELMAQRKFAKALEKWQALDQARPEFRDVTEQAARAQQQIELSERYARLAEMISQAKEEAQAILAVDATYPDDEGVFDQLGIYNDQPVHLVQGTSQESEAEQAQVTSSQEKKVNPQGRTAGGGFMAGGAILLISGLIVQNQPDLMILFLAFGVIMFCLGILLYFR